MQHPITRYIIVAAGVSSEEPVVKFLWEKGESNNLISLDISQACKIYFNYCEIMKLVVFKVVFQKKEDFWILRGHNMGVAYKTFMSNMKNSQSIEDAYGIDVDVYKMSPDDLFNELND
jgi:hypothetical protein